MSRKRKYPSDCDYVSESWSRTEQYKVKGRHQWTIDDFMRRAGATEVGDSLCSPVFSVDVKLSENDKSELTFQLEAFPNGEEGEDNSDYVAVFLTSRRQEDLDVKYDFSVQRSDGTTWGRIGNTFKKFSPEQNSWGYGKAFSKAKLNEKASELLPGGRLTIVCNLEVYYTDRLTSGKRQKVEVIKFEETDSIGDQLFQCFNSPAYSDLVLRCGERVFHCHKAILAARSDVFAAMFAHKETKESKSSEVIISDIEPDILEEMLKFIYRDKSNALPTYAASLLTAADKYNISRLKILCEETMCENIEESNAADVLVLAYLHEAKNLRAMAIEFVTNNMSKVAETPGWKVISQNHPAILAEIVMNMNTKLIKS